MVAVRVRKAGHQNGRAKTSAPWGTIALVAGAVLLVVQGCRSICFTSAMGGGRLASSLRPRTSNGRASDSSRVAIVGRHFFGDIIAKMTETEMVGSPPKPPGLEPAEEPEPPVGIDAPPEGFDTEPMELEVVKYPHPALRRPNALVINFDEKLKQLSDNLLVAMYNDGGVGLAAPQVGVNLRVMVYNHGDKSQGGGSVYVNPRIIKYGSAYNSQDEACLSFPGLKGAVSRPSWIQVQAQNLDGVVFTRKIENFEARLFMHEYDHLDGVLYVDRLDEDGKMSVQSGMEKMKEKYVAMGGRTPAL